MSAPSPTPEVHGGRASSGNLIERVTPDGDVVFSRWSPGGVRVESAAMAGDAVIVALVDAGEGVLGAPEGSSLVARLAGLDARTGEVLWDRPVERYAGYGRVASLGEGVVLGIGAAALDLGGATGVIGPSNNSGVGLAIAGVDACGEATEAVVFQLCAPDCPNLGSSTGDAQVGGLAVDPADGTLVVTASIRGRFGFGRHVAGLDNDSTGVLLRLGAPAPPSACAIPDPFAPVLSLELDGAGVEVEVDGYGSCTSDCDIPVPPFAELRLRATSGAPSAVSGDCAQLPCTLYADVAELRVTVAP